MRYMLISSFKVVCLPCTQLLFIAELEQPFYVSFINLISSMAYFMLSTLHLFATKLLLVVKCFKAIALFRSASFLIWFCFQAAKYLSLERQFLDMGFPSSKVKEALLLHNADQNKALEELMSGV